MKKSQVKFLNEIHELLWGYLFLRKDLSQRQLSVLIADAMKKIGEDVSMETIQRLFSHKANYIEPLIKNVIVKKYNEEKLSTEKQIKEYAKKNALRAQKAHSLVSSQDVLVLADLWVQNDKSKSKRLLAKKMKEHLLEKGYIYHLGSLQNILCGKIAETKYVVKEGLRDLLKEEYFTTDEALDEAITKLSAVDTSLYKSISSAVVFEKCQEFLIKNPAWSKRKLAITLACDLKRKGYHISYNSLQYALAGKRSRVKKIIQSTLEEYLEKTPINTPCSPQITEQRSNSLKSNLSRIYNMVETTQNPERRHELSDLYLKTRESALKKLWEKRQHKSPRQMRRRASSLEYHGHYY